MLTVVRKVDLLQNLECLVSLLGIKELELVTRRIDLD